MNDSMSTHAKDGEKDQGASSCGRQNRRGDPTDRRPLGCRVEQFTLVSQPSFANEGDGEEDGGDCSARDKERMAPVRSAGVGDVGEVLAGPHFGVVG